MKLEQKLNYTKGSKIKKKNTIIKRMRVINK